MYNIIIEYYKCNAAVHNVMPYNALKKHARQRSVRTRVRAKEACALMKRVR